MRLTLSYEKIQAYSNADLCNFKYSFYIKTNANYYVLKRQFGLYIVRQTPSSSIWEIPAYMKIVYSCVCSTILFYLMNDTHPTICTHLFLRYLYYNIALNTLKYLGPQGNISQHLFVIKPNRCTNFTNVSCRDTLHVSDSSPVHHQEFIHCTLGNDICHTGL
jgi:hypothetical protein